MNRAKHNITPIYSHIYADAAAILLIFAVTSYYSIVLMEVYIRKHTCTTHTHLRDHGELKIIFRMWLDNVKIVYKICAT